MVGKNVREARLAAWLAGADEKGSLRDKSKKCFMGLGTRDTRAVRVEIWVIRVTSRVAPPGVESRDRSDRALPGEKMRRRY